MVFRRCAPRLRAILALLPLALFASSFAVAETKPATQVAVVAARATDVQEALRLSGTLTPRRSAGLSPRVDGLVEAVLVETGDEVEAGAPLLRLDATLARAAQARIDAGAAQARAVRNEAQRRVAEARHKQQICARGIEIAATDRIRRELREALHPVVRRVFEAGPNLGLIDTLCNIGEGAA